MLWYGEVAGYLAGIDGPDLVNGHFGTMFFHLWRPALGNTKRGKNKGIHQDSYRSSRWVGWVELVLDHTRGHLRIPTMIIYSEQRIFLTGIQNFRNLDPVISMTCQTHLQPAPTPRQVGWSEVGASVLKWAEILDRLERGGCKLVEVG